VRGKRGEAEWASFFDILFHGGIILLRNEKFTGANREVSDGN